MTDKQERRVFRGFQEFSVSAPASSCASCGRGLLLGETAHQILGPDRVGAVLCGECRRDPGQWFARDDEGKSGTSRPSGRRGLPVE